jgi:hypothetical protein
MTGKLLGTMLQRACVKDDGKDRRTNLFSVAVGEHSVVATDNRQAIVVGQLDRAYEPTDRKSAAVEAARAVIYNDTADFRSVERLATEGTGEILAYPNIANVLQPLREMVYVADMDPRLLKAAAEIAIAAGAQRMTLYRKQGAGDYSMLGLAFEYTIDIEQLTLDFDGDADNDALLAPVPVCGVLIGMSEKGKQTPDVDVAPETPFAERVMEAMKANIQDLADELDCDVSIRNRKGTKSAKPRKKSAAAVPVPELQTFDVDPFWEGRCRAVRVQHWPRFTDVEHEPIAIGPVGYALDRFDFAPVDPAMRAAVDGWQEFVPSSAVPNADALSEFARDMAQRHIDGGQE